MDFDEILPDLGEYGTYQRLVLWFLLLPGTMPCGFHAYNQLFMASTPDHWCRLPPSAIASLDHLPQDLVKNLSIPYDNTTHQYSHCQRYDYNITQYLKESYGAATGPPAGAGVVACDHGWMFELDDHSTSVVADWELVCERGFMPTLALVLFGASGLVGNYVFGYIQDGCGRRPAFFIYLVVQCAFGIATAFTPSFSWWLVCRVGVGFTVPAIMSTPMVLAIELVGPSKRTYTTVVMNVAYSCTLILLACVAYMVRDWAQLSLATTIPFLAFLLFWWVLPESPRWLLANGRMEEAEKIMEKMARVNGKSLPQNYMANLRRKFEVEQYMAGKEEKTTTQKTYGVLDLFRTPNLCRKTLIITFIWFTNTSVYVGLSYYAPALGGDAYLNFFLAGVAELPTYLFLWPAMEYWGRRWTLCFSMVVGGSACVATVVTQEDPIVTLVLYCVGKFGISSSFVVLPLMASELYPTVVRGMGLSVSAVAGMIGPVVIPLINHLGSEMMVLPLIIMGILLNLGGVFSLLLPETLHQHLPQTLEEGEEFGKHWTLADYCTCCPQRPGSVSTTSKALAANYMEDVTKQASGTSILPSMAPDRGMEVMAEADLRQRSPQQLLENGQKSQEEGEQEEEEEEEGEEEERAGLVTSSRKVTVV